MRGEGQFGQFADLRGETWQNRGGGGGGGGGGWYPNPHYAIVLLCLNNTFKK